MREIDYDPATGTDESSVYHIVDDEDATPVDQLFEAGKELKSVHIVIDITGKDNFVGTLLKSARNATPGGGR